MWGEGIYIILLLASGVFNWVAGLLIGNYYKNYSKLVLILAIGVNILAMFYFKYIVFFITSINLASAKNLFPIPEVILPIGISFYTFHAVSYLVDVYRKNFSPEKKLTNFMLYMMMFPQLIAGPIVRYGTIFAQLNERSTSLLNVSVGIKFFIIGLAQKILIANIIADPVDKIFNLDSSELDFYIAWLGVIGYTLQIYFDFAGYSNMAIGLALILGIRFPENFNYPYIAQSLTEFWRRWHITLSTWFRDYVYIPLGGNRKGNIRTFLNLIVIFILCGLWHGASWTFVIWGLYHGFFLVLERTSLGIALSKLPPEFRHLYLILVVMLGWVIFRADSLSHSVDIYKAMFGFGLGNSLRHHIAIYLQPDVAIAIVVGIIASTGYFSKLVMKVSASNSYYHKFCQWGLIVGLSVMFIVSVSSIAIGNYNPFIYFRF
jgi:alginate O-acetyltransferase complex protein AlgI